MKTEDNKLTGNGQVQAEPVMQASMQLLPLIMNNIPQAVFWKNRDLVYLGCNQAFAEDAGFSSPAEIVGKTDFDMPWKAQAELYRADDQRVMEYGEAKINYEEPQTTPNGSTIWLSTSKIPVHENGQVVAVLGMYEDITTRKQAENALHASEEQFRTIYDNATIGLYRTTPEGRILMINPTGLRMLGFDSFEELSKRNLEEAGFEQEGARKEFREKIEREGAIDQESEWVSKDGTTIFVRESAKVVRDENGEVLYYDGSFEDITERKQAEAALHESEERLRRFSEATLEGLVFHEQGKIVDVNPAAVELFGLSNTSDLIGRNLMEFIVPEYHQLVLQQMQLESVSPYEVRGIRHDGSSIPVETSTRAYKDGERVIRASSIRDITERKQADQALRESQQLLQLVMDNIPQSVFWKDKNLTYIGANQAFAKDAGFASSREVAGKSDFDMPWKEQAELYRTDDSRVLKSGETKLNYEEPQTGPTGKVTWLRTSKIPMQDVNGNTFAVLGMYEDVTERKQAEEELQQEKIFSDAVINGSAGTFFLFDTQGNMIRWNEEYEKVLGYTAEETRARNAVDPIADEDKENTAAAIGRAFTEGQASVEANFVTKNGERIPYYFVARRFQIGNQMYLAGTGIDITERKQLEAEVQKAFERRGYQVQISTEISQEIAAAPELNELFGRVVTLTKERLGFYHTQLLRYDAAQDAVVLVNGYGEIGRKMLADGHQMPMGSGLIGTAAASGETILRPNLADDPDWQPHPLLPDTQGEIAVSIKLGDQILGVLDVQSDQAGALTEDDRLLLEGICGQVAVAIEQTRLRQEMAERLEEVNRLYRSMSHEGWKTYRDTADLPAGFMFDQAGLQPVGDEVLADELFSNVPMRVLGGEVVGTLTVANDPQHPATPEDYAFLQQVSDQIALAMESARLAAQTQSALAQTEKLSEASLRFARSADLQELLVVLNETLGIPKISRATIGVFEQNSAGDVDGMTIVANWWNGIGHKAAEIGLHYTPEMLHAMSLFLSPDPIFINDTFNDDRLRDGKGIMEQQHVRAIAVMPLYSGTRHIGTLLLESEEMYNFTQDEIRLVSAMAPQTATAVENRRQFERARQQAERESTLNVISQKIQSATTVEAVLQIAARELGHALGAPMTIAQLSMKDKK